MFIGLSGEGFRMLEQERVKLLFGPYRTPKCKVGRRLRCAMRGKITVKDVAERTGRTLGAVQARRYVFGVPNVIKRNPINSDA